jgi:putative ABC transport system permease protein
MGLLHYKQSLRNLGRNKVYAAINVAGLSISIAFILLVALYVQHAIHMDTFSSNTAQLYRVELTDLWGDAAGQKKPGFWEKLTGPNEKMQITTPVSLALDLKKDFGEVENAVRIGYFWNPVLRIHNQSFKEDGKSIAQVDRNFFRVLGFPLIVGNTDNPFPDKYSAVISERAAGKYFGKTNPVGQTFTVSEIGPEVFTVAGIAKDFPANSSLQFDIITCIEADPGYATRLSTGTNNMSYITLLQVKQGTDIENFGRQLDAYAKSYFGSFVESMKAFSEKPEEVSFHVSLRPFVKAHMNVSSPWPYYTDVKSMYQLILLACIALGIAIVNYVLLSLTRVAARTQEAGIRKTLGAGWFQVVRLFLAETHVLVLVSMIAGVVITVLALPFFNSLTHVNIQATELMKWKPLFFIFGLAFLLTALAGIYPALQMAGIGPLNMLRKYSAYKISPGLSKVFITLQYTSCIVLIVFAMVVAKQMKHVYEKDLGFETEQLLLVENPYAFNDEAKSLALRNQIHTYTAQQTAFTGATGAGTRYGRSNFNGHMINGKREYIKEYRVDFDFFEVNKIALVAGRFFSADFPADTIRQEIPAAMLDSTSSRTHRNMVVNETLYKMLGQPPLGTINRSLGGIIVGVCANYVYDPLFVESGPMYHICTPDNNSYFLLKIAKQENVSTVVDKLKAAWPKMAGIEPFSYSFMQDDISAMYESQNRWMIILRFASQMAIFIACLGLFGLSAVAALNRTKEIGIRKVLGAEIWEIFYLLNKGTLAIVFLSTAIAVPLALYLCNDWLQGFVDRIGLHWSIFAMSGGIGLFCAVAAVSFHTWRAATANPVKSLRTE